MKTENLHRLVVGAVLVVIFFGTGQRSFSAEDKGSAERGRYLAIAGDCIACHTQPGGKPFAGGQSLATPFGAIRATNITPSKQFGIGSYTLAQFSDAVRRGIRADGAHLYPAMPYPDYARVTDEDLAALYEYFMHAVAPVEVPSQTTKLSFPFNIRGLMAVWNALFLDERSFSPDPRHDPAWNRGAYLVQGLAHCGTCHTPRNLLMAEKNSQFLAGQDLGAWYAPNITSDPNSGIGTWTEKDIVEYLRTGHIQISQAAGPMAEAVDASLSRLTESDLNAISAYLRTVVAVNSGDSRPPDSWGRPADYLASIRGRQWPPNSTQLTGPQLYDGYCATCHEDAGQGSADRRLPSLFHNTSLGRTNTNNLVMAILAGVNLKAGGESAFMPAFASELTDDQIVTLGNYLMQTFGNPRGGVTHEQVARLRKAPS